MQENWPEAHAEPIKKNENATGLDSHREEMMTA